MSTGVITFDHVWKKFQKGERHDSLRDLIPNLGQKLIARATQDQLKEQEFWAVRDVSFQVLRGEALGIIGPNGAGKSTTLKLLTRILRPTTGQCSIQGRTGALIEVAAGFHPDLTGRENVFLQGAIMGMSRADISHKLDDIIEFSGLNDFIDTQVKRYSSGMNARRSRCRESRRTLVIDEVLAVGDMAFSSCSIACRSSAQRRGHRLCFAQSAGRRHSARAVFSPARGGGDPDHVIQAYRQCKRRWSRRERFDSDRLGDVDG